MAGATGRIVPGQPVRRPRATRERLQDILDNPADHREAARRCGHDCLQGRLCRQRDIGTLPTCTWSCSAYTSQVRIASVEAFASFFRSITKKAQSKYYSLIGEILNILPPIKDSGDAELLSKALVSLIDLAEVAPKMFKPLFNSLVQFSISVIQDKDLGETARQNALELMATFADNAPLMCKKDANFTNDMVTQCLSLMTDVGADDDDAEEWNVSEDLDEESDSNHVAGEQCMDRLANKLGGQAILPPTFNWLPRMMTSSAWRDRNAALMAISAISEG